MADSDMVSGSSTSCDVYWLVGSNCVGDDNW